MWSQYAEEHLFPRKVNLMTDAAFLFTRKKAFLRQLGATPISPNESGTGALCRNLPNYSITFMTGFTTGIVNKRGPVTPAENPCSDRSCL